MKGVILAAGYGTRFLPASKTVPKEMFPLIDRPAIAFVVDEFIRSGICEILIVTSRRKKALEDYFDREIELEGALGETPRAALLAPPQASFTFIRQQAMRGTGDALLLCEDFAAGGPLVIAYPDDLVLSETPLTRQLLDCRKDASESVLAVMRVPEDQTHRYGIVEADEQGRVARLVEKPAPGTAHGNLAQIGRYLITPEIFPLLKAERGNNPAGEFFQINPLNTLAARGRVRALAFTGRRLDIGQPDGYLEAILEYALTRTDLRPGLIRTLKQIGDKLQG